MPLEEVKQRLRALPGWRLTRNQPRHIRKRFELASFLAALRFVNEVGRVAEEEAHHPDITIQYSRVTLEVFTHDAGGITEKDFSLASRVEALPSAY